MLCCVAHVFAYRSQRNRRVQTSPSQGILIGTKYVITKKIQRDRLTPSLIERTNHVYRGSDIFFLDFFFRVEVRH